MGVILFLALLSSSPCYRPCYRPCELVICKPMLECQGEESAEAVSSLVPEDEFTHDDYPPETLSVELKCDDIADSVSSIETPSDQYSGYFWPSTKFSYLGNYSGFNGFSGNSSSSMGGTFGGFGGVLSGRSNNAGNEICCLDDTSRSRNEPVPLPATVWMGLVGTILIGFSRVKALVG